MNVYTYTPQDVLFQVIYLLVWSITGAICLTAIADGADILLFYVGITAAIMAISAQIAMLVTHIRYNQMYL
jgi:hypothetical protein